MTLLLCSFFLQCVTFLFFWSNISSYGFCKLRSGHRLDFSHLFVPYFRMKPQDFPLESCRGKKNIKAGEKIAVAGKQFFQVSSGKDSDEQRVLQKKEGPWLNTWQNQTPVADFCGHLFVCIYQSLNLQVFIPSLYCSKREK